MSTRSYGWTIPFMRAGYAGRGLTYAAIAATSLWAIWSGGQAQGTQSALERLTSAPAGVFVLALIAAGLVAYCIWRVLDSVFDLEDYGTDGKGLIARAGMVITGFIHAGLGVAAFAILMGTGSRGGGMTTLVQTVFELPMGRYLVGLGSLATLGAGVYYLKKALNEEYRDDLRANHFTVNWNFALKAGVAAQGLIVTIIGAFFFMAALTHAPSEAGGLDQVFSFLTSQPFGQAIVVAICIGLAGFALFCFVNAAYRIVPNATMEDVETLGQKLKQKAEA
ncbi:DUF1206 domain-containing protein [Marivita sp. S6314]|uniref:DUF1206 domain-containing protein n=1 Tax=Marivita sp. S6314 TaxID=2926406 RepID=UPI001FF5961A|nr:DUF1206 domain-containing protein [Marivita sp. S6314]MCK0151135.1 DUF1206 domain-containing protein [Marivita sp. S6314]